MGVNSLPKTVTRQRRDCDLNPGPSAPEYSTPTTRPQSHPVSGKSGPKDQVALYFAFALVHDSRGIEIVNFTISLALSAGTLMASAGTPYRLVPAHFHPCIQSTCSCSNIRISVAVAARHFVFDRSVPPA